MAVAVAVADGQKPGMSEYSRGDAEARRDSEAEVFFFSAFSAPPREPALRWAAIAAVVAVAVAVGAGEVGILTRRRGEIQK